jgi:uncharacterized protein (DUF1697 family)
MITYVAFLRGINVGGNNMLPMKDLKSLCEKLSLEDVRTYIQSGNVIFKSLLTEKELRLKLESALDKKIGKKIIVMIRTKSEIISMLAKNPFPNALPSHVGVYMMHDKVSKNLIDPSIDIGPEKVRLGKRELYIYYPNGMGHSKLKLPSAVGIGSVRNINTIGKIVNLME